MASGTEFDWDAPAEEKKTRRPGGSFTARFTSQCPECWEDIEEGDVAYMRDGQAVCGECVEGGWG